MSSHYIQFHKSFDQYLLSNPVNRQTDTRENVTSLAEVQTEKEKRITVFEIPLLNFHHDMLKGSCKYVTMLYSCCK